MKLRKLLPKDAPHMLSWMHDDSINRWFPQNFKDYQKRDVLTFIRSSQKAIKNTRKILDMHLACADGDDIYLGTVSLKNIDHHHSHAEYAISFCKRAHGTGAAKFATDEILRIAFAELKLERVYWCVVPENKRANSFYIKQGFILEGVSRKHVFLRGAFYDLNWYGIIKDEYVERSGSHPEHHDSR